MSFRQLLVSVNAGRNSDSWELPSGLLKPFARKFGLNTFAKRGEALNFRSLNLLELRKKLRRSLAKDVELPRSFYIARQELLVIS